MKSQSRMSQTDVDIINKQLKEHYGTDLVNGLPIWRVVWAAEQYEKRIDTFDDRDENGQLIRQVTEMRECPKYQWIKDLHILERLVVVPLSNVVELAGTKISYELLFMFWDKNGNYLPPNFNVCQFVIETVYAAQYGTGNLKKFLDPEGTPEKAKQEKVRRINEIVEYLHGEDASFHDQMIHGEGILMPSNYQRSE